ncbi:MAG: hypothetical protein DRG30_03495 [Epsilonproteobacteria bacterium]|nr:MAG: hypothetical protein DRG30_03495 [Campylobacterota bacterium]
MTTITAKIKRKQEYSIDLTLRTQSNDKSIVEYTIDFFGVGFKEGRKEWALVPCTYAGLLDELAKLEQYIRDNSKSKLFMSTLQIYPTAGVQ